VVLIALGLWALQPPAALDAAAPPDRFSAGRALATLTALLDGVGPHPTGTAAAARVRARIEAHLADLGYVPEVVSDTVCNGLRCATVHNVLALREGTDPDAPRVAVSTHYDSVPAGPGASDDGAGVASALELARLLANRPTRSGVLFLFNEGEETNLLGAQAFVASPATDRVGAIVNLEARGTRGRAVLFETSGPSGAITRAYASQARHPAVSSLYVEIYRLLPNGTDLGVYANRGLPGINLAFIEGANLYHTALDDLAHLDPGSVQHLGEQALAAVVGLADRDLDGLHGGDDVVFDVLGAFVVRWPAAITLWLAVGLTAGFAAVAVGLVLRGHARWLPTLAAIAVVPAGLGLTLGAAMLVALALSGLGASWHAVIWPFRGAMWATALVGVAGIGSGLGRFAGPAGLWIATAAWLAAVGVLLAVVLPGGAYLVLPGLAVAVSSVAIPLFVPRPLAVPIAIGLTPLSGLLWVHLALGLETGLGASAITVTAPAMLGLLPLAPLLAGVHPWRITAGVAAVVPVFAVIALGVPAHTADAPQAIELAHIQHRGEATWQAQDRSWPNPGTLPWPGFSPTRAGQSPVWLGDRTAPAAPRTAPDPTVRVIARTDDEVRLRLASPRGGHRVGVVLPSGTRHFSFDGARVPRKRGVAWFFGETPTGIEVELRTDGPLPATLTVMDMALGAPLADLSWPDDAVPIHDGIVSVRIVDVPLTKP
jgi:hypothetical protein